MIEIRENKQGVFFKIKVQPRASKNEVAGLVGDALKVRLTSPPVDGEANEACIKFFADTLSIPKSSVEIINGHTSRTKTIFIKGLNKLLVQAKIL